MIVFEKKKYITGYKWPKIDNLDSEMAKGVKNCVMTSGLRTNAVKPLVNRFNGL